MWHTSEPDLNRRKREDNTSRYRSLRDQFNRPMPHNSLTRVFPYCTDEASHRFGFSRNPSRMCRHCLYQYFQDVVALLFEQRVSVDNLIKCEGVREQRSQINPMMEDQFHKSPHTLLSTRTECCDNFVIAESRSEAIWRDRQFA
jgi:hypothetical protein